MPLKNGRTGLNKKSIGFPTMAPPYPFGTATGETISLFPTKFLDYMLFRNYKQPLLRKSGTKIYSDGGKSKPSWRPSDSNLYTVASAKDLAFKETSNSRETNWENEFKHLWRLTGNSAKNIISFNAAIATLWTIWIGRNKLIFTEKDSTYQNSWEDICSLTGSWSSKSKIFKN
ncbi:LINE-1 retrotransposable element ORF2 protein [Cucumis melo var. makuwa]|uniref:LINE-1 retrotransposable element ORF2 protein n=1 Tax=Cucumis melo var. makuwa TaxID=1194695 RepID=A0A5A7U8Q3_CUCMM|nr:LINE-1 retrotransposable element ORF2 protein [Cucumis melo var. makuwa]TYK07711.1 LINE-1 retrotransposable element ORF2 protein [Cucumis melo var. makuwa]